MDYYGQGLPRHNITDSFAFSLIVNKGLNNGRFIPFTMLARKISPQVSNHLTYVIAKVAKDI